VLQSAHNCYKSFCQFFFKLKNVLLHQVIVKREREEDTRIQKGLNSAYQRVNRDKTNRNIYIFTKIYPNIIVFYSIGSIKDWKDKIFNLTGTYQAK
jgi:hypothetical protein